MGVALVTGAATRLGRVFATTLASEGFDVVVHYWSNSEGAEDTCREIRELGRRSFLVQTDLSQREGPHNLAEAVASLVPSLDLLVNNASVYPSPDKVQADNDLLLDSVEEWERSMAINARAPFFLIQQCVPLLRRGTDPAIINILDMSVTDPFLDRASHSVSKSALAAITTLAASTLAPHIKVNALELGPILPGDNMPPDEVGKTKWLGTEVVADALRQLLHKKESGKVVRVV